MGAMAQGLFCSLLIGTIINTIGTQFFGDFLRIIHVRNPGVAFSFGAGWNEATRRVAFSIIPIIVLALVFPIILK